MSDAGALGGLAESSLSLRLLATQIALARDEERRRIAAAIHDDLGQLLAALRIQLGALRHGAESKDVALIDEADRLAARAIDATRSLAFDMMASPLRDGVGPALADLAARLEHRSGIRCSYRSDGSEAELSASASAAIFRVVREAITNAAKHSGATRAGITVEAARGGVRVTVEDNGRGFATGISTLDEPRGVGLLIARERMHEIDGHLAVDVAPGGGTRVIAFAPVDATRLLRAAP
jgi:signal transduction histidine kinase